MKTSRFVLFALLAVFAALGARATIGTALQMQLGNPSGATADASNPNHTHYLIQKPQYALDYNDTTHEPNWVSWDLTTADLGGSGRSDNFFVDTGLPAGFYQVLTTDYAGSGYDRGHVCPSGDRTITRADNDVTFFMSNMMPQTPDNNRGIWASFEEYCRSLASAGNEVLITAGTSGFGGSTIASGVAIPGYTWKIVVVVPVGPGSAVDRIVAAGAANIRVITIKVPNISGISGTPWASFVTSPAQIQTDTGYTFFTALPAAIASAFRNVVDGSSPVGSPTITSQPSNQTTVVGGTAAFTVAADGDAPLSYQWMREDIEIAGATSPTLTLANVQAADVGDYYAVVRNSIGSTTSQTASLVVTGLPPVVTAPPAGQTVNAGANVTFAVSVTGSPIITYQWRKNTAPIGGATGSTLTLTNVQAGDAGSYDVVATNSSGFATSAAASLVVNDTAPLITTQPASRTATTAENVGFTVVATGTGPLTYQWRKDGSPIADGGVVSGTNTASLLIAGVTAANGGSYDVIVGNGLGSVTSSAATLLVNPPPPSTVFWDFGVSVGTALPTSGLSADITGGLLTQNNNFGTTPLLTTTSASTGSGASGTFNAGAATVNGATLNLATSTYFEFTLAPGAGKRLLITGLSFRSRSTGTGPQALAVYSSANGYASALTTLTNTSGTNWALYSPTIAAITGVTDTPITFRIYGYNGAGATGSTAVWRIDDLKLTVSAIFPPPVAPVVTATAPANGATSVVVSNPISVTFNEAVSFIGTWFTINSASAGALSASVSGGPTTFNLSTPSPLPYNDTVTVTVHGDQVVDQASGTLHGAGNTTFSFTTQVFVPPTPPSITGQPTPLTVNAGSPASFSVTVLGTPPFNYQWRRNGTPITGNSSAATATLSLAAAALADAGSYDCVVSNVAGSNVSSAATLTVNVVPPSIATQPAGQMVGVGGNVSLTVAATGTAPLTYQWRRNGAALNDAGVFGGTHTATLTLTNVSYAQTDAYDVVVTNSAASATSAPASVVVSSAPPSVILWNFGTAAPTSGIPDGVANGVVTSGNNTGTTPPALISATSASNPTPTFSGGNNAGAAARIGALNQTAGSGSAYFEFTLAPDAGRQFAATALTFGARSTGTGPQAYSVFTSIDGFTNPVATGPLLADTFWHVITTPFAGVIGSAGAPVTFRIYGHSGLGNAANGTVNWRIDDLKLTAGLVALPPVPPTVSTPADLTATVGDTVQFDIAAAGTAPFTYQWRFNGAPITGNASATTASLIVPVITTADAGEYDCVVTNIAGFATSSAATLTVNKAIATVSLGTLGYVYTGSPQGTTATTNPGGLNVIITYDGSVTAPTNAGSYAVIATIDDANYTGSATDTLNIGKAPAGLTLDNLDQIYTGAARTIGGTTSPVGLAIAFTYEGGSAAPVNAGSYNVGGTIIDPNYTGGASGTLTVAKATAGVTLDQLAQVYDGSPKLVTVTTAPTGLVALTTYNGVAAAPTNVGSYAVSATVVDPNYAGSAAGTLVISQGQAVITLGNLTQTYDGTPKSVTVTTTPANVPVTVTYDGLLTVPTGPGSYAVVATSTDANRTGSANGTLVITVTALVRHAPTLNSGLDGSVQMLLPEAVTLNGSAIVTGDLLVPGTPTVQLNGNPTYNGTVAGSGAPVPANYTVTLNGKSVLRHVVTRTNAIAMPSVGTPPSPSGTRDVTLNSAGQNPGDFATVRHLTLNGNSYPAGLAVPAGTYGNVTINGNNKLIFGVAGAVSPAVYNLQNLVLNGNSEIVIAGPVVINLANGTSLNGAIGAAGHPAWLTVNIASGGLTLNSNAVLDGTVIAPDGTITINGRAMLTGRVVCDRLTINGSGLLTEEEP